MEVDKDELICRLFDEVEELIRISEEWGVTSSKTKSLAVAKIRELDRLVQDLQDNDGELLYLPENIY